MKILAFDTCFSKTYITLCDDNKIIVSKHIQLKFDKQLIKCFDFCPLGFNSCPAEIQCSANVKSWMVHLSLSLRLIYSFLS